MMDAIRVSWWPPFYGSGVWVMPGPWWFEATAASMTDEENYIRQNLSVWDRVCQWAFMVPAFMVMALVINGVFGEPVDRYLLLKIFVVTFPVSLIMRVFFFARKVKRLEAEYYVKTRH